MLTLGRIVINIRRIETDTTIINNGDMGMSEDNIEKSWEDLVESRKWNVKRKLKLLSCKNRGIEFNLSSDDMKMLYLRSKGVCDYTGVKLNFAEGDMNGASLERISEYDGYSLSNCIIVSIVSNRLKSLYLETKNSCGVGITVEDKQTLNKICEVVFNPEKLKQVQSKYLCKDVSLNIAQQPLPLLNKETNTMIKDTTTHVETETKANIEIHVAGKYASFGRYVETNCEAEFNLTYAQFKQLVSRKKCMLTKRELPRKFSELGFFILDKTLPVGKGNIYITTKELQERLDSFVVSAKLSLNELKQLCKTIGEK